MVNPNVIASRCALTGWIDQHGSALPAPQDTEGYDGATRSVHCCIAVAVFPPTPCTDRCRRADPTPVRSCRLLRDEHSSSGLRCWQAIDPRVGATPGRVRLPSLLRNHHVMGQSEGRPIPPDVPSKLQPKWRTAPPWQPAVTAPDATSRRAARRLSRDALDRPGWTCIPSLPTRAYDIVYDSCAAATRRCLTRWLASARV
jgi:hypothetical protein